jgi:hypothetical protein
VVGPGRIQAVGDVGAVPERLAGSGAPVAPVRNLGVESAVRGLPSG